MQDVEASVIALERFDEALRDAVAFGLRTGVKSKVRPRARDVGSVLGDVGTSVIGQPFDWMWRACAFEPALDGGEHEIAYHLSRRYRPSRTADQAMIRSGTAQQ